jgi:NADH dehydrogenase (ubiquinone) Fe-S protein 2
MYRSIGFILNFGPQHPAAHGVLRLILMLLGETIVCVDAHIGLLHRGTEKLLEYKTLLQGLPYMDRLDYVSMMVQEEAYSLSVESLLGINVSNKAKIIRVLFAELTRILNHLLAITTHALDVGALTPFLWGFEEREKIMEFYERVSGARMHAAYIRPGGVTSDLSNGLIRDMQWFVEQMFYRLDEIDVLLTRSTIWNARLRGVGYVNTNEAFKLGYSGVMLRGSGLNWDLRRDVSYDFYNFFSFRIPVGVNGDCYDRYLVRLVEMRESLAICMQALSLLKEGVSGDLNTVSVSRRLVKSDMQSLINHFKLMTQYFNFPGDVYSYVGVEAPKGEFGVFFWVFAGALHRVRLRAPGFMHLQSINYISRGQLLADLVAIIGTLDIVFGEIDR